MSYGKHIAPKPLRDAQKAREKQWIEDSARRATNGRRLWRCWHCDVLAPWGPSWSWYGSYKELEDGAPIVVVCSEECRAFLVIKEVLPRDTVAEATE